MPTFSLTDIHRVIIPDIPLQWMTRTELFSYDLEQFPLMYVHLLADVHGNPVGDYNPTGKQRIFGFVLTMTWGALKENNLCDVTVEFVCNIPQGREASYDGLILDELKHRIGIADKVSYEDLEGICENNPDALPLLQKIWRDKIDTVYGAYIPHGRIFEKVYGIVRFSASGNAPRLGKISEFRMLYWYMVDLGDRVEFSSNVSHLKFIEFYLIPSYEELVGASFDFFDSFKGFYKSTKKFWDLEYTRSFQLDGHEFKYAGVGTLPSKGENFDRRYTELLGEEYDNISRLRQIFNRMPGRLYGYIWNLMSSVGADFSTVFAQRDTFRTFYRDHGSKKGFSPKVVACFLQQVFGIEALPIDTWIRSFIYFPLGMSPNNEEQGSEKNLIDELYTKYNRLDKLEKLIWVSSMGNKTNKTEFIDILWCQRYGTDRADGGPYRGANPLACSQCILRNECISYQAIKNRMVCVSENRGTLVLEMRQLGAFQGVLTEGGTPRHVYTLNRNTLRELDSHSGLDISTNIILQNGNYTVDQVVHQIAV